jgi:hypothetical protein
MCTFLGGILSIRKGTFIWPRRGIGYTSTFSWIQQKSNAPKKLCERKLRRRPSGLTLHAGSFERAAGIGGPLRMALYPTLPRTANESVITIASAIQSLLYGIYEYPVLFLGLTLRSLVAMSQMFLAGSCRCGWLRRRSYCPS